ncbi:nickel pincer cofactor biosynthesis protein LarB [Microaerobacter geothermalis]|uniref:nickel pincer cofactor biosynthesis protein LarB n=1 Tax=Microaerobacter geothermalis TaxID=674972 RepID=UPI002E348E1D|nr:nickel pincer cofactor biosynthesis protein LarB [Microaerobacter geothermalis]
MNIEDLGFAKLDLGRKKRTGFPEVIFGQGKTADQLVKIFHSLKNKESRVLATRITREMADAVKDIHLDVHYHEIANILYWSKEPLPNPHVKGYIAVVCAGTSDLPVAEEAAVTAEVMGCTVQRFYDVGVAGIHRLFTHIDPIREADAIVVVAGMEGALPSVVGGLVDKPIVAVPTSIGYGAHFSGLAPLLTMLNSCAPGIAVVNIDNGYGGGSFAARILHNKYSS